MPDEVATREKPGEAINRLCREQGRVKGWVASQVGIGQERLSRLIAGEREISAREAAAFARVFDVPVETFIPAPTTDDDEGND